MTNRILIGWYDGDFVARISNPGVNVLTNTNMNNFMMHEDFSSMGLILSGLVKRTPGQSTLTISFSSMGFVPLLKFASALVASGDPQPTSLVTSPGLAYATVNVSTTSLRIVAPASGSGLDLWVNYWIYPIDGGQ